MKNKTKYLIIIVVCLIIVIGLFYILVINNNVFEYLPPEEPTYWYDNNLSTNSEFAMRELGNNCNSRYLYFYKNKVIIADWEDTNTDPIILDVIYYKDSETNPTEIFNYVENNTLVSNYYNPENNNTNKSYNGAYQLLKSGSTLFIETTDSTVKDFLSTISPDNLFDCHS